LLIPICGSIYVRIQVSVDWRLAPETTFPDPLEDCYVALKWFHANARESHVDPRRIASESVGGGLAALLAIAARNRGRIPILFQLPLSDNFCV
jgi:acetyl esterase/lipase